MSIGMVPSVGAELVQNTYYDALGRVTEQTGSNGQRVDYSYDAEGRQTAITDALGRKTQMEYDPRGRLIKLTDPAGNITRFAYDLADHVTRIIDPRGLTTSYQYDGLGQLRREDSPDTGTTVYEVNALGQRTAMTRADGSVTHYSYDGQGRLVRIRAGEQEQTFSYDRCLNGLGRLCQATAPQSSVAYSYTPQGDVTERLETIGSGPSARTEQMAYRWDSLGRLSQLRYPNGIVATYGYSDGETTTLQVRLASQTVDVITSAHRLADTGLVWQLGYAGAKTQDKRYDHDGLERSVRVGDPTHLFAQHEESYTVASELETQTDPIHAPQWQHFHYDSLSRLQKIVDGISNPVYGLDANGNRLSERTDRAVSTSTIDAASNRLTSISSNQSGDSGRLYDYDVLGNRIGETTATEQRRYRYNPFNRLSEVTANGTATHYLINALDQRVSKESGSTRSDFGYDEDGRLAYEKDQSGKDSVYLWFAGQLVGLVRDGKVYNVATDRLGRPEVAWDSNNAVVWRAANRAFDRSVAQDSIGGVNIGFPGQYYDKETGFWYNGHRDYDAATGRYLQSDPLGLAGGINPYLYANGSPLMNVDSAGLWSVSAGYSIGVIGGQIQFAGSGRRLTSYSTNLGIGLGGGFSYDPQGGNPDRNAKCGENGHPTIGIGVFENVGVAFGPLSYGFSASRGLTLYKNAKGQLTHPDAYSNPLEGGLSFSTAKKLGVKLEMSTGIEITHYINED